MSTPSEKVFRPKAWLYWVLAFGLCLAVILKLKKNGLALHDWSDGVLFIFFALSVGGLCELARSRVVLRESELEIRGIITRRFIPFEDIGEVSFEDGLVAVRVRGAWVRFPYWFSDGRSVSTLLRNQINKVKHA